MRFCFKQKDFIEQSIKPDRIAVIDKNRELTWLQFETEVNNICLFFKQNKWEKLGKPILLYGHKQIEMITVMYAMMKLNITYIPIDIIYPKQRILAIQQIAGVNIILNCTDNILEFENTTEIQVKPNELTIGGF